MRGRLKCLSIYRRMGSWRLMPKAGSAWPGASRDAMQSSRVEQGRERERERKDRG